MASESPPIHDWRQLVAAAFTHCPAVTISPADPPGTGPEEDDLRQLVESACNDPIESLPLAVLLQDARRVAVVLPEEADALSSVTVQTLLNRISESASHAHRDVLTVPTATNPLSPTGLLDQPLPQPGEDQPGEMLRSFGAPARRPSHPVFRPLVSRAPVLHPITGEVLPVRVDPILLGADVIVAAHRIRPDALLGLTGGSASVLLGSTSPRTLQLLRSDTLPPTPTGDAPLPRRSPIHRGFRRIARHLPPLFALAECTGDDAFACASGQPDAVFDAMTSDGDAPVFRHCGRHDAVVLFVGRDEATDLTTAMIPYLHLVRQARPPLHPRAPVVLVPAAGIPETNETTATQRPPRIDAATLRAMVTAACAQHPLHVVHPAALALPLGVRSHHSFAQAMRTVEMEHAVRSGAPGLDLLLTRGASRMLPVARIEAEHRLADSRPS